MDDILKIIDQISKNQMVGVADCKKLLYYGFYDCVTGLKNRHSLNLKLKEIDNKRPSNSVIIIYADINALKFTNDHISHDAGDDLIRRCAFLLVSHFGKDRCYRISGDEFVVLLDDDVTSDTLDNFLSLKRLVNKKDIPPMAIGVSAITPTEQTKGYITAKDVEYVLSLAEKHMYEDKQSFYRRFPEFKR